MLMAVFSDIHGNARALDAVLADAEAAGAQGYIFLGDMVTDGPDPVGIIKRIRGTSERYPTWILRGNREEYMLEYRAGDHRDWIPGSASGALYYTYHALRNEDLDWFSTLSPSMRLDPEGAPSVWACHGSPTSSHEHLLFHSPMLHTHMEACPCGTLLCGHTHKPLFVWHKGVLLLNPGSVGLPNTGRPLANYLLMDSETAPGKWWSRLRSVPYDTEAAVKDILESDLPEMGTQWTRCLAATIRTGTNMMISVSHRAERLAREKLGHRVSLPRIPDECWKQAADELEIPAL